MKTKIKKQICLLLALFTACSPSAAAAAENDLPDSSRVLRIAGNYVCFDEEEGGKSTADLRKGILLIEDGRIKDIDPYEENTDNTVYLDDHCVIFPGLLDLHSHVEYGPLQLWDYTETDIPWDNRFEWRRSAEENEVLRARQYILEENWDVPFSSGVTEGDIIEYFTELQAAAGGTTFLQGYNDTEEYNNSDSHAKLDLIRSSSDAQDTGRAEGEEILSLIQVFRPDAELSTDDPSTYLPPIDTEDWNIVYQTDFITGEEEYMSEILSDIENGTSPGYLIHLAEGRAGNFLEQPDSYTVKEFECFKKEILSGIEEGRYTAEDVKNAHINLIHACTCDLDNEETCRFVRDCGIGLLWAPVSNLLMYGDTPAFYDYLDDNDLLVGIGSDWSPGGSKTVWDECRFAYGLMQENAARPENASESLLKACTLKAARMAGVPDAGNIAPGKYADLFILRGSEEINGSLETALRTFIETDDSGVWAVLTGGKTIYGEEDFIRSAHGDAAFSSYGRYDPSAEGLENKYFLLPGLFKGSTFQEIYRKYLEMTSDAGIELSMLRSSEDPVYNEIIHALESKKGKR